MYKLFSPLFLLFIAGTVSAQAPELGVLPPQVYIYTEIIEGPLSIPNALELNLTRNKRSEPEISEFTDPLEVQIAQLAPSWLESSGAKGVVILTMEGLSNAEKEEYQSFHNRSIILQGNGNTGGLILGVATMEKQNSVYLKDDSNKFADKLDRDYLLMIDVFGYGSVLQRNSDMEIDPNNLKGGLHLVVSILDAATGVAEVTRIKSTLWKKPKRINSGQILKDMESLVEKVVAKFNKQFQ